MNRLARLQYAFLFIILLSTTNAIANECPDDNKLLDLQAGRFQAGWSQDGTWVNFVHPGLNYDPLQMYEMTLSSTPSVTVRATMAEFTRNYGWAHLSSHGFRDVFAVEFYPSAAQRNQALLWYRSAAGGSYTTSELTTADIGTTLFGLGITVTGMRRGTWTGGFVHLLSCYGSTLALGMPAAKAVVGHNYQVSTTTAQADDRTLIENMAGFHNFDQRTLGQAIVGTTLVISGRNDLELAPAVQATDLVHNQHISAAATRYVHFTGMMNTSVSAALVVKGTGSLRVKNQAWQGSDQISFTVNPIYRGEGAIKVISDTTGGYFGSLNSMPGMLPLVGNVHGPTSGVNGPPGTSGYAGFGNYEVTMYSDAGGQNPASTIASYLATFNGAGVQHTFVTEVEDEVKNFFLRRSASPTGPFLIVAELSPQGPSRYELHDPVGSLGDYYELWEVTTDGDSIRRDATRATWETSGLPDPIISQEDGDRLIASQLGRYPHNNHPNQIQPALDWAALIPDESWRAAVQPQADFWASRGMSTGIFTVAEVNAYGGRQAFVRSWVPFGLRYWLRVGVYNNADYHNNPLYYRGPITSGGNGWSNAPYSAQPQYKILPLEYALDPAALQPPSTTNFTPEAPIILDGDVDGDSLSDICVGTWPARTPAEAALMGLKQRKYIGQEANGKSVAAWSDERTLNGNDGAYVHELFDQVLAAMPADQVITRVMATDTNGGADPATRQAWGLASLASQPNTITVMATTTTRANWIFLNKLNGFSWAMAPTTTLYPYLSAASCDMVDADRSEDTISLPGRSRALFAEAMMDTTRAPACGWGFPRGTFVKADQYALIEHNRAAYEYGVSSGAEAMMRGNKEAARVHPEYKFQFMTATYFGDPATPIKGFVARTATGVDDGQNATTPSLWSINNPSHGRIQLGYTAGVGQELSFYDLQGRRVWAIGLSPMPGAHAVTWDGQTLQGQHAAPGLYLARTNTGRALKVTLLR